MSVEFSLSCSLPPLCHKCDIWQVSPPGASTPFFNADAVGTKSPKGGSSQAFHGPWHPTGFTLSRPICLLARVAEERVSMTTPRWFLSGWL